VDPTTSEPTTKLTSFARDFFASAGCNVSDVSELLAAKPDDKALKTIQQGIDKANRRAVSRAQVIQKWTIIPRDFSIPGGELGRWKCCPDSLVISHVA
jgi:long-chain-fatty-acid--CoA ligase ACSBG